MRARYGLLVGAAVEAIGFATAAGSLADATSAATQAHTDLLAAIAGLAI